MATPTSEGEVIFRGVSREAECEWMMWGDVYAGGVVSALILKS
jgi:hypothetical protein